MTLRRAYRWIVFALAAGYLLRQIVMSDYDAFGGPFRFLTIWALCASFFVASRMLAQEEGRTRRRWDGLVGATAVMNLMVVFLYWRLYFADPFSVQADGELGAWWLEMYLHALGPALQWIDALFIHRGFRRPLASVAWLIGIVAAYFAWIELAVAPRNGSPAGDVTSGLPYPFLNDLDVGGRAAFYLTNVGVALAVLAAFTALGWLIARTFPRPEAPGALPGSSDRSG